MGKLKQKLKRMKCMKGIILYRQYQHNKDLRQVIDAYNNKQSILFEEETVKLNNENKILYIMFDKETSGFFACWLWCLTHLYYAEKYNLIPYIDWTEKNAYFEENGINGTKNPFEYYFQQVSSLSLEEAKSSTNKVKIVNAMVNTYSIEDSYQELAKINKRYMRLHESIQREITNSIHQLLGNKKTLAVHVRGVEWGNIAGHPVPLSLDKYIEKVDEAIEKEKFEQIFLATDSEDTIEYLSNKYKDKIVFYNDVARASKGSKALALFDESIKRKNNHYLLGLEVLRDMMTLAACQGLIAGYSNISAAAIITKMSNEETYDYKYIFKQKINSKGVTTEKAVEKMKKETK